MSDFVANYYEIKFYMQTAVAIIVVAALCLYLLWKLFELTGPHPSKIKLWIFGPRGHQPPGPPTEPKHPPKSALFDLPRLPDVTKIPPMPPVKAPTQRSVNAPPMRSIIPPQFVSSGRAMELVMWPTYYVHIDPKLAAEAIIWEMQNPGKKAEYLEGNRVIFEQAMKFEFQNRMLHDETFAIEGKYGSEYAAELCGWADSRKHPYDCYCTGDGAPIVFKPMGAVT